MVTSFFIRSQTIQHDPHGHRGFGISTSTSTISPSELCSLIEGLGFGFVETALRLTRGMEDKATRVLHCRHSTTVNITILSTQPLDVSLFLMQRFEHDTSQRRKRRLQDRILLVYCVIQGPSQAGPNLFCNFGFPRAVVYSPLTYVMSSSLDSDVPCIPRSCTL